MLCKLNPRIPRVWFPAIDMSHQKANQGYMEEGIKIFELAQRFVPLYDAATPDEKQQILRFLLLNCTLSDATPTATYRKPFNWLAELAEMKTGGAEGI